MYNENEISLTEATVLALQGKLKLEETKPARRSRRIIENKKDQEKEVTKEIKEESVGIDTDNVTVSVDDNGNTTVETEKEVITVTEKDQTVEDIVPVEEPTEEIITDEPVETIDVPVEGDETVVPEEEVELPDEEVELPDEETIEDEDELDESKKVENKEGFSNKVEAIEDKEEIKCEKCDKEVCECAVKTEAKTTFNKQSFEEALTKFYKFNSEKVESFKVESVSRNKKGSIKIEGKLNDKVDTIMIFDKLTEGNSYVTYKLRNTNGILEESKDITTSMFISKKFNNLNCRRIISK